MSLAELLFWSSLAWIAYTLIVYPGLAVLLGVVASRLRPVRKGPVTPRVSVLISAYNEEAAIERKVRQTLALDYPAGLLEVIVASDGSTDRTDEIVQGLDDPRVTLYRAEGRLGKTAALNGAVTKATGEILIFSDATGEFNPGAIRALVSNFADDRVGCVAGRVAYRYGDDATSAGFSGYQRVAVAVRRAENGFGDQTSVSGSIHAVRRELFRPGRPGFSMDVIDALHTVVQGRRVVYEYDAVSLEDSRTRAQDEFRARVRISVRNASMAPYIVRELIGSRKLRYAFQMVSHKFMRWWLWLPLLVAFASNLALAGQSRGYLLLAALQVAFYGCAAAGLLLAPRGVAGRVAALAGFFLMGNAAMCVGTLRGLAGAQKPAWEPVR